MPKILFFLVMPKSQEYPLERITIVLVMPKSKKIPTKKKHVCPTVRDEKFGQGNLYVEITFEQIIILYSARAKL